MPKNYASGGRAAAPRPGDAAPAPEGRSWRERLGALRNIPLARGGRYAKLFDLQAAAYR